jgi:hypothetical protein
MCSRCPVIANTLRETGNITGQGAEVVPNLRVLVSSPDERINDLTVRCESCPQAVIQKVFQNFKRKIDA